MDEAEGSNARAREKIGVCGRAAPLVAAEAEGGAGATEAVDSEVEGSCEPGALGKTVQVAGEPAVEVSASGGFVLAEASANIEAMS